jgi:two-component system, OmpR family, response regulator
MLESLCGCISIRDNVLDTTQRSVSLDSKAVKPTVNEFDFVARLVSNVERVASRNVLAKLASRRELHSTSNTVGTNIYRLRRKLSLRPENGVRFSTVYTHGCRLDKVDLGLACDTHVTFSHTFARLNRTNLIQSQCEKHRLKSTLVLH